MKNLWLQIQSSIELLSQAIIVAMHTEFLRKRHLVVDLTWFRFHRNSKRDMAHKVTAFCVSPANSRRSMSLKQKQKSAEAKFDLVYENPALTLPCTGIVPWNNTANRREQSQPHRMKSNIQSLQNKSNTASRTPNNKSSHGSNRDEHHRSTGSQGDWATIYWLSTTTLISGRNRIHRQ